jgi:hypothetical protein
MSEHRANYLSATLELTESVVPETTKLCLTPLFDEPVMEVEIDEGDPGEDRALVTLNPRQIECLVDFLSAWLARLSRKTPENREGQNPVPNSPPRERVASP